MGRPEAGIVDLLTRLALRIDPGPDRLASGFRAILAADDRMRPLLLATFLSSLTAIDLSSSHVAALLRVVLEYDDLPPLSERDRPPADGVIVCVQGSGKKSYKTPNITTPASLIAAACGTHVAKIGSYGTTSSTGSREFLDTLCIRTDIPCAEVHHLVAEEGFGFYNTQLTSRRFFGVYKGSVFAPHALMFGWPAISPLRADTYLYGLAHPDVALARRSLLELGVADGCVVGTEVDPHGFVDEILPFGRVLSARIEDGSSWPELASRRREPSSPEGRAAITEGSSAGENLRFGLETLVGHGRPAHQTAVYLTAAQIMCMAGHGSLDACFQAARAVTTAGGVVDYVQGLAVATGGRRAAVDPFAGLPSPTGSPGR